MLFSRPRTESPMLFSRRVIIEPPPRQRRRYASVRTLVPVRPSTTEDSGERRRSAETEASRIGGSVTILGEISCKETLVIDGRVDGGIDAQGQLVIVGPMAKLSATTSIRAKQLVIQGCLIGAIEATEEIYVGSRASVAGDISTPVIVIEDCARVTCSGTVGQVNERYRLGV